MYPSGFNAEDKLNVEHTSDTGSLEATESGRRRREAPPLVKDLTAEERHGLELILVRKIDIRLLPSMSLSSVFFLNDEFMNPIKTCSR